MAFVVLERARRIFCTHFPSYLVVCFVTIAVLNYAFAHIQTVAWLCITGFLSFTWERDCLMYLPCWLVNWVLNPRISRTWTHVKAATLASSSVNRLRLFLRQLSYVCVRESFIHTAIVTTRAFSGTVLPWQRQRWEHALFYTHTHMPTLACSSCCDASVAARLSVWFASGSACLFGFRSQWVERTLGLAGFVSHGCGYICPLDCCFSIM